MNITQYNPISQGYATCGPRREILWPTEGTGYEDHIFSFFIFLFEINSCKSAFIPSIFNFTCVDQFSYGDRFDNIAVLL